MITQNITKFRKEAMLKVNFWLGGVVLANSGYIFKHSDKFSFWTTYSVPLTPFEIYLIISDLLIIFDCNLIFKDIL